MSQQRLNHCMILHIHKELTDSLSLLRCVNQFIYNENRRKNFDKFSAKDLIVHNNKFNRERRLMMSSLYLKDSK